MYKWIAYGLTMPKDILLIDKNNDDIWASHDKALEYLNDNRIEFDTLSNYDPMIDVDIDLMLVIEIL
ncbi:hypothetical protein CUU60_04555 [Paenibacillus polymyxa ATCC 842]|uniref:Uncharacterized protein n=3 Tax=Paenibacillus polymyxa TaxID=1406 RepID=A0A378XZ28_PAEPO|nr:hypothetical protein [Paenibacillus polymyxa]UOD84510.1 hypothetical protein CUU60_04555 [Paenibacillus polymyxa ATCC 842]SUA70256.1 Uncharacterised protein [Paenibacillus polymyxa]